MAQFIEPEKVIAGSPSAPRTVSDPPSNYSEFNPTVTSEHRSPHSLEQTQLCTTGMNNLSTLLNDIQDVIKFAKHRFLKPRMITLTNLKENLDNNKTVLEATEKRLDSLDVFIKVSMENISSCVCEWDKRRKYYTQMLNLICDPVNPSPNMNLLRRCSKMNEQSYVEVVKKMVQLCCKIERELRLAELKLSSMDELSVAIRKIIQEFSTKVNINSAKLKTLFNENYVGVYCLLEKTEQDVNVFKCEWQKGGGQHNSTSPRLYTTQTPLEDNNWTPPCCPLQVPEFKSSACIEKKEPQQYIREPLQCSRSRTNRHVAVEVNHPKSTQSNLFSNYSPRTIENRSQAVKDIVGRYNDLHHAVRDEMENIKFQQQFINRNEAMAKRVKK